MGKLVLNHLTYLSLIDLPTSGRTSLFPMLIVGWYFFSILFKSLKKFLFANSGEPDQTSRFVASDLRLHCLPLFHKKDVCVS